MTERFDAFIDIHRSLYICPVAICSVVTIAVMVVALTKATMNLGFSDNFNSILTNTPLGALAGFAGAYIWGLYECLDRFRARNWTSSSFHHIWLRLLLGTALGALVPETLSGSITASLALLIAFSLSAYSTDVCHPIHGKVATQST